jgi:hypothetical protein
LTYLARAAKVQQLREWSQSRGSVKLFAQIVLDGLYVVVGGVFNLLDCFRVGEGKVAIDGFQVGKVLLGELGKALD